MKRRTALLGAALIATLALSAWALYADGPDGLVAPVLRSPPVAQASAAGAGTAVEPGHGGTGIAGVSAATPAATMAPRAAPPEHARNLFGAFTYQPPRRTESAVVAPPRAPALPFAFAGRLIVDGASTFLLLQGETPVPMTLGAEIGDFKLVAIEPSRLVFLHGPTGERVPLAITATGIN